MTTAITTKLKTHYAVLKDGRTIPVTTPQKDKILTAKEAGKLKTTDFVHLDGYTGECGSIKEFVPIPQSNTAGKGYYCDYGHCHELRAKCECTKKYGISAMSFQKKIFEKFPNIQYSSQITERMRQSILSDF